MTLEEFKEKFSPTGENEEESQKNKKSRVLREKFDIAFKLINGDIYIFSDGQVGLGLGNKNIQSINKIDWDFAPTYFSIDIGKIKVKAEVVIDDNVEELTFDYKLPISYLDEPNQFFDDEELKETSYNDGQSSRDRQASLVIFSKNRGYIFEGEHIPGVCTITQSSYSKNGKWSNTTFSLLLNKGYKISRLRESWGLGYYKSVEYDDAEPNFKSLDSFKESLGMSDLSNEAFTLLVKSAFKKEYVKYCLVQDNLESFYRTL